MMIIRRKKRDEYRYCSRGKGNEFGSVRFIWCDIVRRGERVKWEVNGDVKWDVNWEVNWEVRVECGEKE